MSLNLLVIEPHPALTSFLKTQQGLGVIASANTLATTVKQADLVLVSADFAAHDLLNFVQRYAETNRIVIMDADESDPALVTLLEAGAAGYINPNAPEPQIVATLEAIYSGGLPIAPRVSTALVERMHELLALQQQRSEKALLENCPDLTTLTSREREILVLIRSGASNQDIAEKLTIQLGTVKNHVHSILKKLNVTRRQQAASYVDLFEQAVQNAPQ